MAEFTPSVYVNNNTMFDGNFVLITLIEEVTLQEDHHKICQLLRLIYKHFNNVNIYLKFALNTITFRENSSN